MGATASKPARSAASAASRRQYPKTASPGTTKATPTPTPINQSLPKQEAGPTYHSKEQASASRSEGISYPLLLRNSNSYADILNSNWPRRPRSPFRRLTTLHRPRNTKPYILPLQHIQSIPPLPSSKPTSSNTIRQSKSKWWRRNALRLPRRKQQSRTPGAFISQPNHKSRRTRTRVLRKAESSRQGISGCYDYSAGVEYAG